ncbi:hypothetical protein O9K63_14770 [Janibacter cremeus]|uniref:hypothetical protein n=1 Tax=Janibacter cremeus TaxID=1285192 RepID=UPI0023F8C448|nr:hypothetical protein [Janibacter cremeus]WEV77836.1 hypothetical protein O9K63_14770 [Janibacter cremeus]
MTRFEFAFSRAYRAAGLPFGVNPRTAWAAIDGDRLSVHFGPWRLRTSLDNIANATITGGFAFIKTAGPAHLSLADRGVTFATNGERAVCLEFHRPVTAIDPMGLITHPNATLTPSDPESFLAALGGDLPEAS